MSALCNALPKLWALNPGMQATCAHHVKDKLNMQSNYWICFVCFSISHIMTLISALDDDIDMGVTNVHRSLGAITATAWMQWYKRENPLCLLDMHCTGTFTKLDYIMHLAPIIFWLWIPGLVGWVVFDLAAYLRLWIKKGGFTTKKGLLTTGLFVGVALFLAGMTTLNASTWPDLPGIVEFDSKSLLSAVVYVVTFPTLVMKALTKILTWLNKDTAASKTEKGLGEGKIEKSVGDGKVDIQSGDTKGKALDE